MSISSLPFIAPLPGGSSEFPTIYIGGIAGLQALPQEFPLAGAVPQDFSATKGN